jgi:hypothetical protein
MKECNPTKVPCGRVGKWTWTLVNEWREWTKNSGELYNWTNFTLIQFSIEREHYLDDPETNTKGWDICIALFGLKLLIATCYDYTWDDLPEWAREAE